MRIILRSGGGLALAAFAVAATVGLGGCSAGSRVATGDRVRVVVVENFWGSIVEQLAGAGAEVTSLVTNPATDPHDYEPTAADARAIASAGYVVMNGMGYDEWVQKLLDANPVSGRSVLNVGDLLELEAGENPHQWYSPRSVRRFIGRVRADLQGLDPENRAEYARRERAYETEGLREYNRLLVQIRERFSGTAIGASESIVTPLATDLGLRVLTPESFVDAIAEGGEPSKSDKATVDAQIAEREIEVFVYNAQNATPDVQRLVDAARRKDIPVVTVTETLGSEETFQAWQERQLRALLAALSEAAGT